MVAGFLVPNILQWQLERNIWQWHADMEIILSLLGTGSLDPNLTDITVQKCPNPVNQPKDIQNQSKNSQKCGPKI